MIASAPRLRRRLDTIAGVTVVGFLLFPLYWTANAALQKNASASETKWFPVDLSLTGFENAIDSQLHSLGVSLGVACGSVLVALAVSIPAAYGLAHLRTPGVKTILGIILVTQMIPHIVIANALYTLYNSLHLLNSPLGLVLADASSGIPFGILLIRSFMISIPKEIIEAARIDGAGRLRTLLSVVVPLARNSIITAGLFSFLFAWSDLIFALTLTTTDSVAPITLGIYRFLGVYNQDWGTLMAIAILASLPAAVLLVSAQKFIAGGIASGSLK